MPPRAAGGAAAAVRALDPPKQGFGAGGGAPAGRLPRAAPRRGTRLHRLRLPSAAKALLHVGIC